MAADGDLRTHLTRATMRVDAGVSLPGEAELQVAVEILVPREPLPLALVCVPGGAMNRRYFDLRAPGLDSYSFALQMVDRGFIVVLVDPLGVGESSRPADGFALTTELLARANAHAVQAVLSRLREGHALPGLAPIPGLASVGVGHSMGAMLTIVQQAQEGRHKGLAILGFSTRGLPEYLGAEVAALGREEARARLPELARRQFREPYPSIPRSAEGATLYAGKRAESAGIEAIKAARERLLAVPAFQSMLPGNVAPEAAAIEVPVYVAVGELDMTGPAADVPRAFPRSWAVTLEVLPQAGHAHFIFPARGQLFDTLARWARALLD
jgi:pimeloyl-ACP methyl ester carboxylesterase